MKRVHSAEHGDDSDWTPPTYCERGNFVTSAFVHLLFLRFAVIIFLRLTAYAVIILQRLVEA